MSNSEVPEGYKQTEVGVIPEDWEVKKLGDVLQIRHGRSQHEVVNQNGIYPILATGGEIGRTNIPLYSEPSVLIGRKGTINIPYYMDSPFWTVDTLFYSEIFKSADPKFVFYKFNLIDWYSYNEASGVPSLNASTIENINQSFPETLEEQRAIAQVLSEIDALIAKQDKLIAKKRHLKTATMQQLLTGKKRLPGFGEGKGYRQTEIGVIPEDWVITTLDAVSSVPMQNGVFYKPSHKGLGIKLINVGDLYEQPPIKTESLELFNATDNEKGRFKVENGDLFFTRSSVVSSGIGHCNIYFSNCDESVVFDSHVIRVRSEKKKIEPAYLFRFCISSIARQYLISHAKTATMTTIDQGVLGKCPIFLPPLPEQRAIAQVLSDMDTEITALETRRDKTKAIKQGMMQELLTGRTRLI